MKNLVLTAAALFGLAVASMGQTLPAYLPTDGLVGWWPFNGNANDESGNGNDGTVNGATLTTDRFGVENNSYLFSNNTNVSCPIESSVFGNGFTISLWCKFLGYENSNSYPTILIGENYNYVLQFTNTVDPPVLQSFFGSTSPGILDGLTRAIHSIGEWVHILVLNNQGITTIQINGNTFAVSEQPSVFQGGTLGQTIRLGGGFQLPAENFNGTLDDVAIYNRALTQEEITALYTGEPVNPPTACNPLPANLQNGLVGYWPFCGNANDESGNGNDGTVNGATLTEDRFGVANEAYYLDGQTGYLSVPVVNNSLTPQQITVAAWCKIPSVYTANNGIGMLVRSRLFGYIVLYDNSTQGLRFETYSNGNSTPTTCSSNSNDYSDDTWHHVVGTFNGNVNSIFIDGYLIDTSLSAQSTISYSSDGIIAFGRDGNNASPLTALYQGSLDDIGIWNRALIADEVQQLYTLNACTFTVYDTDTVTQTVYDTVTTYTSVTDTLIINTLITGINPPNNSNTIKVFPNPTGSFITIDYGNFALMSGYQLRIENSLGQQVFQTNITQQSDFLSLSTWGGNGLYFLHIIDPQGNTIDIRKVLLQ